MDNIAQGPTPEPGEPGGAVAAGEPAPAPVAPLPRFCKACGAPWQPAWIACANCAPKTVAPATVGAPGTTIGLAEPDGLRRIKAAVGLYFTLLTVSLVLVVAGLAGGAGEVTLDIAGSIAMSLVVLIWCGFSPRAWVAPLFKPVAPMWLAAGAGAGLCTVALAFAVIETLHRAVGMEKLGYSQPFLDAGYG